MSDPFRGPVIAEVRVILTPVRWSEIDARVRGHQDAIVDEYLGVKDRPLIHEDGEPMLHKNGRQMKVTQRSFAERCGMSTRTLSRWLHRRGQTRPARGGHDPANPRQYGVDYRFEVDDRERGSVVQVPPAVVHLPSLDTLNAEQRAQFLARATAAFDQIKRLRAAIRSGRWTDAWVLARGVQQMLEDLANPPVSELFPDSPAPPTQRAT